MSQKITKKEPVLIGGAIIAFASAVWPLLIAFGVDLTEEQTNAAQGAVTAGIALVTAFVLRGKVIPVNDPEAQDETDIDSEGGIDYVEVEEKV